MTTLIQFIIHVMGIGTLYVAELYIITQLLMQNKILKGRQLVVGGIALAIVYGVLMQMYGMNQEVIYIVVTAIIVNSFFYKGKWVTHLWGTFVACSIAIGEENIVTVILNKFYCLIGYDSNNIFRLKIIMHVVTIAIAIGLNWIIRNLKWYKKFQDGNKEISIKKAVYLIIISTIYGIIFNVLNMIYNLGQLSKFAALTIIFAIYFTIISVSILMIQGQYGLKREYAIRRAGILNKSSSGQLYTYNRLDVLKAQNIQFKKGLAQDIEEIIKIKEISKEDREKVIRYLELIKEKLTTDLQEIETGNQVIDMIFNEKLMQAKEKDIKFEKDIHVPNELNFKTIDLIISIESVMDFILAEKLDIKTIKIIGKYIKGCLIFCIYYIVKEDVGENPLIIDSYKLNKTKDYLKKYNGSLEIIYEGKYRKVELKMTNVGGMVCPAE